MIIASFPLSRLKLVRFCTRKSTVATSESKIGTIVPDGETSDCVEHRQDQSVLSLLIHKYNRHQGFDIGKNSKYGDWQTFIHFDDQYRHNFDQMILSPRESKFGNFRFLG